VNPRELQGKYARLHDELASLQGCGERNKARQVRLACELDQIDRQLAAFRRLAQEAPTLRDVVMIAEPRDELHRLASDGTDARAEMIRSGMAWALTKYLAGPPIKAIDMDVDGGAARAAA
jgi:hypothetical protein